MNQYHPTEPDPVAELKEKHAATSAPEVSLLQNDMVQTNKEAGAYIH